MAEPIKLMEGYVARVADPKEFTPIQKITWDQLEGRQIKPTGKKKLGEFKCTLCAGPGKIAHIVLNEKGEERLMGGGCMKRYFGITPKGGRSGGAGRRITL